MGDIDRALRDYFGNEECVDFINAVNFDGKQVIKLEDFVEKDSIVTKINKTRRKPGWDKRERDFFRMVRMGDAYYFFVGVEQQSQSDPIMPLRVIEYDIMAYREQYKKWKKETDAKAKRAKEKGEEYNRPPFKLMPVITYVVLWSEEKWNGPKTLKGMMDKEVLEQIQKTPFADMLLDYEIKVFTPSEQENFENFKSNLRMFFEIIMCRKDNDALDKYMKENTADIDQPTADVIYVLTGIDIQVKEGEDTVNMSSAYSTIVANYKKAGIAEGIEEGREEGRAEGREEGREGIANSLIDLYEEGFISDAVLLKSAEKNGVLDIVQRKTDIEVAEKKKPSTGRKI